MSGALGHPDAVASAHRAGVTAHGDQDRTSDTVARALAASGVVRGNALPVVPRREDRTAALLAALPVRRPAAPAAGEGFSAPDQVDVDLASTAPAGALGVSAG
ncbi:hypothetical protein ABZ816_02040 [Actinosynnema sp. NPDC047251]|uniref:hypothetical protein n=1 Tax=Saccharothrix espanaensis TaxID=103731 RepID=UPI0011DD3ED1|nr:hypothetical protein [Saccharothrix espanaensis]